MKYYRISTEEAYHIEDVDLYISIKNNLYKITSIYKNIDGISDYYYVRYGDNGCLKVLPAYQLYTTYNTGKI